MSYPRIVENADVENGGGAVTIRRARLEDATALADLAALDGAAPLEGDVLLAEVDGEVWAALALDGARTISDPFRPAAEARALLELRAKLLRSPRPMSFRRERGLSFRRVARAAPTDWRHGR